MINLIPQVLNNRQHSPVSGRTLLNSTQCTCHDYYCLLIVFEKLGIGMLTHPSIVFIIVSRFGIIRITKPNRQYGCY